MKRSGIFLLFMALSLFDTFDSQSQAWTWSRSFGGQEYDQVHAVAVDSFGNSYITGSYTLSASFGSDELQARGKSDLYLAKFDPKGKLLWAISAGGPGNDEGRHLCLDTQGNIYVTGTFSDQATFEDQQVTSHGELDIFLAKFSSEGRLIKVINAMGSAGLDNVSGISYDGQGAILLVGDYWSGVSEEDIFITSFDQYALGLQWMQFAGGPGTQKATGIACDTRGAGIISGYFDGALYMGGAFIKSSSSNDIFVAKYHSNGKQDWLKHIQVEGSAHHAGLGVDQLGNCYVSGSFDFSLSLENVMLSADAEREAFIIKYDQQGSLKWAKSSGNLGYVNATALSTTPEGTSYLGGSILGSRAFGKINLTGEGRHRPYMVKINSQGEFLWGVSHESLSSRNISGVATDLQGNSWMTGELYGENGYEDNAVLTSSREFNGFICRLQEDQSCRNTRINLTVWESTPEGVSLRWDQAPGMEYQYRYRKLPDGLWTPLTTVVTNEVKLTDLEPETSYVFHIRAYCNGNLAENASIQFITVSAGSCAHAPQKVRAADITTSSATLIWDTKDQMDLTGYQFRIRKPDGSWSRGFVNDAYLEITGLDAGSTYELMVNSLCLDSKSSPATIMFTTKDNAFAKLQLSPNPDKNTLFIAPSEPMLVRIYDSSQTLKSEVYVLKQGMEISLSSLEKGSYQVKGVHPLGTITRSLVKE